MGESRPRGTDEEELRNAREVADIEINGHEYGGGWYGRPGLDVMILTVTVISAIT